MLANIHEYLNCCHKFYFLLGHLLKILHIAFLLPVSIGFIQWQIVDSGNLFLLGLS